MIPWLIFNGALGLVVGSFLNVLVTRRGGRPLSGRSSCASCGCIISWYDLVPVLSWLVLRGRCRSCGSRISMQYPVVELLTGMLFLGVASLGLLLMSHTLALSVLAILLAIALYDLRHTIIPDSWVYIFAAVALLSSLWNVFLLGGAEGTVLRTLVSGPVAALPLFMLWFISRGAWMGFGDVKLALGIGWFLGFSHGLFAIFLAFVIGAVVGLLLIVLSTPQWKSLLRRFIQEFIPYHFWYRSGKGFTMKSEVPFGPFLIVSNIAVWFLITLGYDPLRLLGFL